MQKLWFSSQMLCNLNSIQELDSAKKNKKTKKSKGHSSEYIEVIWYVSRTRVVVYWFTLHEKEIRRGIQTHGWYDWFIVHLARNTADAAVIEGRKLKKP